jgi:hypothetical protein
MASWKFSVGNLVSRAARYAVPVSPALEDADGLELSRLGNGYPDSEGALQWRSDGAYEIDFDLNELAEESDAADAPTGWRDLLLVLAGTPGLPANPATWGSFGGRTALRFFGPTFQDVWVMPGESRKITGSIYRPSTSAGSAGTEVRVVDLTTGRQWDAGGGSFDDDGKTAEQTTVDTWLDFAVTITADTAHTERRLYRVIVRPQAASYGATTFGYISKSGGSGSPAMFAEADAFAILGHHLPRGTTLTFVPQGGGTTITLPLVQPSCYVIAPGGTQLVQIWRLTIATPSALRLSSPRPILGEVWIGKARTLLGGSPVLPISVTEGDPNQVRVEGQRRRIEVLGEDAPLPAELMLQFTFTTTSYEQARDEVARLVRFGAEPLLLLPSDLFEGAGRLYHGRLGEEVTYQRISPGGSESVRSFAWPFTESPLASG